MYIDSLKNIVIKYGDGHMDQKYSNALATKYLTKWNSNNDSDKRLMFFNEKFNDWLEQIPIDVQPIVLKLLDNFCYYSHSRTNNLLESLHKILLNNYDITEDDTIYTFIKSKNGKSNSSNDYWTEYKGINNLNKEICIVDISEITDSEWTGINNIVFIDDCCGTGKTFTDYIGYNISRLNNKNIYFLSLHIMHEAKEKIEEFAVEHKLNIILINATVQYKAFTTNYFEDGSVEAKQIIILSSKELGIPKAHILGFGDAESLMAFYNNTPNNTLGILRYDTDSYFSVFPREKIIKPSWRDLKQKKLERKAKNYNAIVRGK